MTTKISSPQEEYQILTSCLDLIGKALDTGGKKNSVGNKRPTTISSASEVERLNSLSKKDKAVTMSIDNNKAIQSPYQSTDRGEPKEADNLLLLNDKNESRADTLPGGYADDILKALLQTLENHTAAANLDNNRKIKRESSRHSGSGRKFSDDTTPKDLYTTETSKDLTEELHNLTTMLRQALIKHQSPRLSSTNASNTTLCKKTKTHKLEPLAFQPKKWLDLKKAQMIPHRNSQPIIEALESPDRGSRLRLTSAPERFKNKKTAETPKGATIRVISFDHDRRGMDFVGKKPEVIQPLNTKLGIPIERTITTPLKNSPLRGRYVEFADKLPCDNTIRYAMSSREKSRMPQITKHIPPYSYNATNPLYDSVIENSNRILSNPNTEEDHYYSRHKKIAAKINPCIKDEASLYECPSVSVSKCSKGSTMNESILKPNEDENRQYVGRGLAYEQSKKSRNISPSKEHNLNSKEKGTERGRKLTQNFKSNDKDAPRLKSPENDTLSCTNNSIGGEHKRSVSEKDISRRNRCTSTNEYILDKNLKTPKPSRTKKSSQEEVRSTSKAPSNENNKPETLSKAQGYSLTKSSRSHSLPQSIDAGKLRTVQCKKCGKYFDFHKPSGRSSIQTTADKNVDIAITMSSRGSTERSMSPSLNSYTGSDTKIDRPGTISKPSSLSQGSVKRNQYFNRESLRRYMKNADYSHIQRDINNKSLLTIGSGFNKKSSDSVMYRFNNSKDEISFDELTELPNPLEPVENIHHGMNKRVAFCACC